jgi:hypothetical protein
VTTRVPAVVIPEIWPAIEARVRAALRHGGGVYRLDDVRHALEAGDWQLWGDGRSIACTRIAEYPTRRVLFVTLASGEMGSVEPMWPTIKAFGEAHGCTAATAFARPGWARSGKMPQGWKHTQDVVTVEW